MNKKRFSHIFRLWKWGLLLGLIIILYIIQTQLDQEISNNNKELKSLTQKLKNSEIKIKNYNKILTSPNPIKYNQLIDKERLLQAIMINLNQHSSIQVDNISLEISDLATASIFDKVGNSDPKISILELNLNLSVSYLELYDFLDQFNSFPAVILMQKLIFKIDDYPKAKAQINLFIPVLTSTLE